MHALLATELTAVTGGAAETLAAQTMARLDALGPAPAVGSPAYGQWLRKSLSLMARLARSP